MAVLKDQDIRQPLILRLKSQNFKPRAIIEELHVHNGNAIADVVALYKSAHCFEIKGDSDKITRIKRQGRYYDFSFRKITLVTTSKHIKQAKEITPEYWGIILASKKQDKVVLSYIRSAKENPNFKKSLAVLTLWKNEMLEILSTDKVKKTSSRQKLAMLISDSRKKEELSRKICTALLKRDNYFMINI